MLSKRIVNRLILKCQINITFFGDITVNKSDIHTSASGKKFLIVHPDEYDTIAQCHKWIAKIGSDGYDFLIWVNRIRRFIRKKLGIQSSFSLAAYVKFKVKNAVQFYSPILAISILSLLLTSDILIRKNIIWHHILHFFSRKPINTDMKER